MTRRDLLLSASAMLAPPKLSLASFQTDITPAVGAPLFTGIARSIVNGLAAKLAAAGLSQVRDLVGTQATSPHSDPGPQVNPRSS